MLLRIFLIVMVIVSTETLIKSTEAEPVIQMCTGKEIKEAIYMACGLPHKRNTDIDDAWTAVFDEEFFRLLEQDILEILDEIWEDSPGRRKRMSMAELWEKCCRLGGCTYQDFVNAC